MAFACLHEKRAVECFDRGRFSALIHIVPADRRSFTTHWKFPKEKDRHPWCEGGCGKIGATIRVVSCCVCRFVCAQEKAPTQPWLYTHRKRRWVLRVKCRNAVPNLFLTGAMRVHQDLFIAYFTCPVRASWDISVFRGGGGSRLFLRAGGKGFGKERRNKGGGGGEEGEAGKEGGGEGQRL